MARQLLKDTDQGRYVTFCRDEWGIIRPHAPGRDYCRQCWPPRGRGRGESLSSPRRLAAKERARLAVRMYGGFLAMPKWMGGNRCTLEGIARALGYADKSGAWRAIRRTLAGIHQAERLAEQIPTPEERALREQIEDYLADLAEIEAEKLAERKRARREAGQRKRKKTLERQRKERAADLARVC